MQYLVQPLVPDAGNAPQYGGGRVYTLTSSVSGKVMAANDGKIVQQSWKEKQHQQWKLVELANGNYKVVNVESRDVLTVADASKSHGARLVVQAWGEHTHQQWKLVQEDDHYRLKAAHSTMSLTVPGGNMDQGTQLEQRNTGDYPAQRWLLGEVRDIDVMFDAQVTVYTERDFGGESRALGPGSFRMADIGLTGQRIRSLKVPKDMRATLYREANFRDRLVNVAPGSASAHGKWADEGIQSLLIEKVVTVFQNAGYQSAYEYLGVGRYNIKDLHIQVIRSLRVPQGLMVILQRPAPLNDRRLFFEDTDLSGSNFDFITSIITIKPIGIVIPKQTLQFGGRIALKSVPNSKHVRVLSTLDARADKDTIGDWMKLTVVRAGPTKHNNLLSYGDVIALQHAHGGKYLRLTEDGSVDGQGQEGGGWTLFKIKRAGKSEHNSFVARGDVIALRSVESGRYLEATEDGDMRGKGDTVGPAQKWKIEWMQPPEPSTVGADAPSTTVCGAAVAGWSVGGVGACGAAACGADICGAAVCGAAGALVNACAAAGAIVAVCTAAVGLAAVCGAAACGAAACGAAVCGAAAGGLTACSADACGVAACAAAACAAAACGAAACGADACGAAVAAVSASAAGACGANAGGVDACQADACGANACGINLCPIDACAADACAMDLIPIVPFI